MLPSRRVRRRLARGRAVSEARAAIAAGAAGYMRVSPEERASGGKKVKAGQGGFTGGMTPYGYERDGDKGLRIVEREAIVIRRIFQGRAGGLTLRQIAAALNSAHEPTKRGGKWAPGTVAY